MGSIPQYLRAGSVGSDATGSNLPARLKLLLPVDATDRSRWSIDYAVELHKGKAPVEAHLLFVAEPVTSWQVLRFRTRTEVAEFQRQYGQWQLEDAAAPLKSADIPVHTHYREGNVAFEILDCSEQIGCDRIVLPQPKAKWLRLFSRDVVRDVLGRSGTVQVVTVDRRGLDRSAVSHVNVN